MTTRQFREWMKDGAEAFPERRSEAGLRRYLTVRVQSEVKEDRRPIDEVMRDWLSLRSEPKTMLAVRVAAAFELAELRHDIESLLRDVQRGAGFDRPLKSLYEQLISTALAKL